MDVYESPRMNDAHCTSLSLSLSLSLFPPTPCLSSLSLSLSFSSPKSNEKIFPASRAHDIGLLHDVVTDSEKLEETAQSLRGAISLCGPRAVEAAKELVEAVAGKPAGDEVDLFRCASLLV